MTIISKLKKPLIFLLIVLTIGVIGFKFISNVSFVDALYMTVITVSTVGFSEIHPFSETEKLFTEKFKDINLNYGKYIIYLKTIYDKNVEDIFLKKFEIKSKIVL